MNKEIGRRLVKVHPKDNVMILVSENGLKKYEIIYHSVNYYRSNIYEFECPNLLYNWLDKGGCDENSR